MKIKLVYVDNVITIIASDGNVEVARGVGLKLMEAVKALVSRFAEMQAATIQALNACGIVHYVAGEQVLDTPKGEPS